MPRFKKAKNKDAAEERKLREAAELVKAAKEAEQKAWREKWEAQQADPEYKRKQAERYAKSEERSRKMAIGKENKRWSLLLSKPNTTSANCTKPQSMNPATQLCRSW